MVKQTKRILKVGSNVGGFLAKTATKSFLGISNKNIPLELTDLLGNLKGPIMKVAQILATIPDALPKEYAEQLSKLQAEAPSMNWLFVKRRMYKELGNNWINNFHSFEKVANKAASLGQVHKAILKKNKKVVACKLQYPDMESAIKADLKQLKLILKIYKQIDSSIITEDIYDELQERLIEEVDYNKEANHMNYYKKIFLNNNLIKIPDTVDELSSSKLITMSWLEGKPLNDFYKNSSKIKNNIAINLFHAWYVPFYKYGIIHGDPHPGNYTIADNGKTLNLLDYGCIRVFRSEFVEAVIKLYHALKNKNNALAAEAYKSWGFTKLNNELIETLNIWAFYLYGPLLENKIRKIQNHNTSTYGKELLGEVRKKLKKFGGVKPPREFVLVDRAAIGLGSVFMHLNAEINWHEEFEKLIKNFDKNKLQMKQKSIIEKS
ncbi:MAG: ABC transporter ATP-binding protein [Pelagibacterales bacterium]|nr:ABC transporter ATP-binding protein [Pelagibacterales bacterium]